MPGWIPLRSAVRPALLRAAHFRELREELIAEQAAIRADGLRTAFAGYDRDRRRAWAATGSDDASCPLPAATKRTLKAALRMGETACDEAIRGGIATPRPRDAAGG